MPKRLKFRLQTMADKKYSKRLFNKKNTMIVLANVMIFFIVDGLSNPVYAYAGPGAAIGVVLVIITIFISFFLSAFITIGKTVKKYINKVKVQVEKLSRKRK